MCDCYHDKCKRCGLQLPVHLGDFLTDRKEIDVFCHQHLPKKNVKIFTINDDKIHYDSWLHVTYPKGWQIGIRYLTKNAKDNEYCNYPNIGADFTEKRR